MNPTARRVLIRTAAVVAVIVFLVWMMSALESVTTVVMVALFLAYLLNPAASRLEGWGVPRSVAALLLVLAGLMVLILIFLVVVPAAVEEVTAFVRRAPVYFATLRTYVLRLVEQYGITLPADWEQVFTIVGEKVQEWLPDVRQLAAPLGTIVGTLFRSTLTVISGLVHLMLIPVLVYYLLVSFTDMKEYVRDLIPLYARDTVIEKLWQIDQVISGFVRGQLTICVILAVLYSIGFVMIRIDLAIVLGTISGLLFIIPYVGTMVGLVMGSLMALAKYGDLVHVLYVICWIGLVQLLEGYVLTPRIVGKAIGLNPVMYILALLIGAKLFGFVGMLVAVPAAAVLKVLLASAVEVYRRSEIFRDPDVESGRG